MRERAKHRPRILSQTAGEVVVPLSKLENTVERANLGQLLSSFGQMLPLKFCGTSSRDVEH